MPLTHRVDVHRDLVDQAVSEACHEEGTCSAFAPEPNPQDAGESAADSGPGAADSSVTGVIDTDAMDASVLRDGSPDADVGADGSSLDDGEERASSNGQAAPLEHVLQPRLWFRPQLGFGSQARGTASGGSDPVLGSCF